MSAYTGLMSVRPWRDIERRQSRQIMVGNVPVGGDAPISVQTMTNTPTEDVGATLDQIRRCEDAGADIIRVSCPTEEATRHFDKITRAANVPIVADIHFHYKRALEAADNGAACLRINPGNIGSSERVAEVVRAAKANGCAIRIGVNAGSLEKDLLEKYGEPCPEALIESALDHIKLLQDHDFHEFKVAVKASDVFLAVAAYHGLADAVDCPLHLGITEAGTARSGSIRSAIGLGLLLNEGIGDTIRISLTPEPGGDRTREVHVAQDLLQSMGFRSFTPQVTACPGCGRTGSDFFQHLADQVQSHLKQQMPLWRLQYPGVESLSVAVMGCVVNGPGESRHADIGISLPGGGEHPVAPVYEDGEKTVTLRGDDIAAQFLARVEIYIQNRFANN